MGAHRNADCAKSPSPSPEPSYPNTHIFDWWLGNALVVIDVTVGAIVSLPPTRESRGLAAVPLRRSDWHEQLYFPVRYLLSARATRLTTSG
jgi:hypothetical protein